MDSLARSDQEKHITILAWLWIARGLLLSVVAVVVFISCFFGGLFSGEIMGMLVAPLVGLLVGFGLFLLALPSLAAGMGLLEGKGWARVLAMILGAINVLDFPLGTALCVYTFWTLWGRGADYHFEKRYASDYDYQRY